MGLGAWGTDNPGDGGSVIQIDRSVLGDARSSVASFGSLERAEAEAILGLIEFERTGAVALTGFVGLTRYLEVEGGMARSEAHARSRLIRHCARFSLTADALAAGVITLPYLRVLVAAAAGLADAYEAAEGQLLALAENRDVTTFERAVANWRNRAETAADAADPARSYEQRGMTWQRGFDGSGFGQFSLDPIAMELLEQALDTPPDPAGGYEQPRTLRQRRADALIEAADHYRNGEPGSPRDSTSDEGDRSGGDESESADAPDTTPRDGQPDSPSQPTGARCGTSTAVDVVVDLATLERRRAETVAAIRAEFASGSPISDAVLEQLLCDASYRRLIIDGPSVVLDHSSPTADITVGLRRAVQLRDRHCQFAGCDRPWNWCDVHHLVPRAGGGATNERNLALVCRHHHTLIHQVGWHLGRDPTSGEVVTTSP